MSGQEREALRKAVVVFCPGLLNAAPEVVDAELDCMKIAIDTYLAAREEPPADLAAETTDRETAEQRERVLREALKRIEERTNPGKTVNPRAYIGDCNSIARTALAVSPEQPEPVEKLPQWTLLWDPGAGWTVAEVERAGRLIARGERVAVTTVAKNPEFMDMQGTELDGSPEQPPGQSDTYKPCGLILIGSGTDTYDPVCDLREGHEGRCMSTGAIDQHKLAEYPLGHPQASPEQPEHERYGWWCLRPWNTYGSAHGRHVMLFDDGWLYIDETPACAIGSSDREDR